MTGLSRAQTTRLIAMYLRGEEVKPKPYRRQALQRSATRGRTSSLLAGLDEAHETLSGPATQKLLQRACYDFGETQIRAVGGDLGGTLVPAASRAARIASGGSNIRRPDRRRWRSGSARRPEPQGRPGYLRVDTVHQGDLDGVKGVYHINAVDEVTQWQVVGGGSADQRGLSAYRCWRRCWSSFPSAFGVFIPTTAASSSTTRWPNC